MATVLERFEKLGLPYSKPVLCMLGERVADFMRSRGFGFNYCDKKWQREFGEHVLVNDYREHHTEYIDFVITEFLKSPNQWEADKRRYWWNNYKLKQQSNA